MIVGVDFDNTIACYDGLFHAAALERGLIPESIGRDKGAVRDYLRAQDREDDWTELQGYVYGPGIAGARPYPGVVEFFTRCRVAGVDAFIVSHKTRAPFRGPEYDLHEAARRWLRDQGFHDAAGPGLPENRVFLELTLTAKLARIRELGCDYFIDDLPELLREKDFPAATRGLLFDPSVRAAQAGDLPRAQNWGRIADTIFADRAALP